jgi:hypothetical protein
MRIADLAVGFLFGFETLFDRAWISRFAVQKSGHIGDGASHPAA